MTFEKIQNEVKRLKAALDVAHKHHDELNTPNIDFEDWLAQIDDSQNTIDALVDQIEDLRKQALNLLGF